VADEKLEDLEKLSIRGRGRAYIKNYSRRKGGGKRFEEESDIERRKGP